MGQKDSSFIQESPQSGFLFLNCMMLVYNEVCITASGYPLSLLIEGCGVGGKGGMCDEMDSAVSN